MSARAIVFALVAAFIAFQASLVLYTGAAGIPGLFRIDLAGEKSGAATPPHARAQDGGESVIVKRPDTPEAPAKEPAEATGSTPAEDGEKRLEGLADIPLKPWVSDDDDSEAEQDRPRASVPAGGGQAGETLPWDAVKPVPFDDVAPAPSHANEAAPQAPAPRAALAALPPETAMAAWVKAKATEIKGVERARPLYHFEFWLEPPEGMKGNLTTVTYEFNTPAVMPQTQVSQDRATGFRISAGGLVCADKVTVTLRFKDGRSQRVEVDGCKLVS